MIHVGLADDDALVRSTLTELLATTEDVRIVWAARDGREALDLLFSPETPEVQVLLLDVQMPRLDGITLAERLRKERPGIGILILTTFVADDVLNRALAAGVRGFIAKEDPVATLADTIRNVAAGNGGGPAAGRQPVPPGVGGARPHGGGAVQQADRHASGPERDHRQDPCLRAHRQARRPGPGRRRRLRAAQRTRLTILRSEEAQRTRSEDVQLRPAGA